MPYPRFIVPLSPCNLPLQRCPVSREKASQRILIIKFGALGDILMATPLLAALRAAYPDAYLTWMAEHGNREAIDANPFVDEVIVWDSSYWTNLLPLRWKKWLNPRRGFGLRWLASAIWFRYALRQKQYDVLISFHPEQWPLLVSGSGCSRAIGIFETSPRPGEKQRDYTHLYQTSYATSELPLHRTEKYLIPLQAMNIATPIEKQMTLGFTLHDQSLVTDFLRQHSVASDDSLIVIAPATTWESKRWPASHYAALGDALAQEKQSKIILIGSASERETVAQVAHEMKCRPIQAAGSFSFRQAAALLARALLVVSGDTGPMHAAAAVGTPYFALFGATTPARYAPLAGKGVVMAHSVPCGPCERMTCFQEGDHWMRCLRLITVEEAAESASRLLKDGRASAQAG